MSTLQGRYEIIETLGTGATSRVDKARDTLIGRTVALKTFLHGFGSGDLQKQFLREAQIIGQLAHPFIVGLYDVGIDSDSVPYFVMEYVEGKTLEKALDGGPLPLEKVAVWGADLSAALARAHRAKIIHGDVKPANILVTKDGQVKLGDFGIARFATQVSTSGNLLGTPAYLSPEQILGHTQDMRSDLFSLGIILYQMATGVRPFTGSSVTAVCAQIVSITPPPPSHHNPSLPPAFDHIVMRCLSKDPADRYATAEALGASLYPFARGKQPEQEASANVSKFDQAIQRAHLWATDALESVGYSLEELIHSIPLPARSTLVWWNRPVQRRDMWIIGSAAFLIVSLLPIAFRHSRMQPVAAAAVTASFAAPSSYAAQQTITSNASIINVSSSVTSDSSVSALNEITASTPAVRPAAERHAATANKPKSVRPAQSNLTTALPLGEYPQMSLAAAVLNPPPAPAVKQTTLHIDVMSEITDQTLAVYSGKNLLLTAPLKSSHRGDTLRFNCPITPGENALRVVLYRGDKSVSVQKENISELHADGANSMEVRVNRRSKMLVKHETSLEVIWPRSSASPAPSSAPGTVPKGALAMR